MPISLIIFILLSLLTATSARAPTGPWDTFNFAPHSKTVYPASIHSSNGSVTNPQLLVNNSGSAVLGGKDAWVALDFGVEVGGLISFNINAINTTTPTTTTSLSLSFTESPLLIRPTASDDSSFPSANTTYDTVLRIPGPVTPGYWTQPASSLRGGFRFLTIVFNSAEVETTISISNVSCAISFMSHVDDLRAYTGYFYALDPVFDDMDFLTKGPRLSFSDRAASADDGSFGFSLVRRRIYCPNEHGPGGYGTDGAVCSCWE
ncbi:hypothetical protein C0995_015629 [Termitomyces sp. Mi166|nr:hypothetical protein C0995_015629 [Termitomyces sp. Mi166\